MRKRAKNSDARAAFYKDSGISWGYLILTIICACVLAAGFFFAALQHFATMDIGFKNSSLRKQVEELEAEKRRLLLAREIALSPSEIAKTARSLGFTDAERQPQPELAVAKDREPSPRPETAALNESIERTSADTSAPARPRVVPAAVRETRTVEKANDKVEKANDKKVRVTAATEPKSPKAEKAAQPKQKPAVRKESVEVADGRPRRVSNDRVRKEQAASVLAGLR
ncbi:MAG: hypothetical protein KF855_12370 [Acidobacteria bacterium]|nr:hypothetical protein [Acidobacteriota bacterium]